MLAMESNLAPQWQANKAMLHCTVVGYRSPIRSEKTIGKAKGRTIGPGLCRSNARFDFTVRPAASAG
jgi:hypothetical protein